MKRIFFILTFVVINCALGLAQGHIENRIRQTENTVVQKIKVFPNPATNVVNILGLKNSSKANILISDSYGNTVLSHQWRIKNNALNIPISTLDSGIYSVTIHSIEQKVQTKFYKK